MMGKFKAILDLLELKELPLHGRKFTWTGHHNSHILQSSQSSYTLVVTMPRINRVFSSSAWEEIFPTAHLYAGASTISNHCPLIIQGETEKPKFKGFRFESYWLAMLGFWEVVSQTWKKNPSCHRPSPAPPHQTVPNSKSSKEMGEEFTLGNGKKTLFWQDNWLHDKVPRDIAPLLYNLAHFKNRTVEKELQNNKWIQGVRCISTREELLQFIELWSFIRNVSLNLAVRDQIQWKWTPNAEYTTASAYKIQFQGSHTPFHIGNLWKAKVESIVKVSA
jgi:hypothetical protein